MCFIIAIHKFMQIFFILKGFVGITVVLKIVGDVVLKNSLRKLRSAEEIQKWITGKT